MKAKPMHHRLSNTRHSRLSLSLLLPLAGLGLCGPLDARGPAGPAAPLTGELLNLRAEWTVMNQSAPKQRGRERYNELKYGMFIHWGLFAIPAGVWKGERMEDGGEGPRVAEWVMRRKEIPRAEYALLADQFNPVQFDADEWVAIAKAAGMKYMVITAKHHDGFALYKSEVSGFNAVDATPFGRDIIRELEQACQRGGIDFGVYYSHSLDWRDGGDGGFKDYAPAVGAERKTFPNTFDPAPVSYADYIRDKSLPQVRELIGNYNLSIMFLDTPIYIPPDYSFTFYKQIFGASPETLVTERVGNGFGDVGTPGDNRIPDSIQKRSTEVIATTNNSWGYCSYDEDWKSVTEILYLQLSAVSRGANFLLNVGPTSAGVIPQAAVDALLEVGAWLKVNGEAIYGTTAWTTAQEGPTSVRFESTEQRQRDGFTDRFTSGDFWFTRKGGKLYAISLVRPADGVARVKSLAGVPVRAARVLGEDGPVEWRDTGEAAEFRLPEFRGAGRGYALEITLE